jgi:AraC family transcriptional regulator of adaptative response/methylated-DNA-[protein]-cysteine methyltransferase
MSIPAPEICWQAVVEKDRNYDGQFFLALKTTGIYCRPSCPSRTPLRENVTFYELPAAARAAGFRPCKRCQPDHHTAQEETLARIESLCAFIDSHLDDPLTLQVLGEHVGWSSYHLQRTFKAVMGISPRRYVDARRAEQFRANLKTGQGVLQAGIEAGYRSSSRIHEQSSTHLGMTPSTYRSGGETLVIRYGLASSPLGSVLVAMTGRGVCALRMGEDDNRMIISLSEEFPLAQLIRDDAGVSAALRAVLDYLQGWQPHIDLPLDIRVTAFQQRVLDELCRIPYGETRTYGEIARTIGQPKAARAVGNACNRNPVPIIIPCHRVIGSDGSLTGYAFGIERKQHLLDLERKQGEA